MTAALLVFLGGGLGSLARYGANLAALKLLGPHFPWGTLAVNVLGGLVMGLVAGWLARSGGGAEWRLFLMTGILGGFTTFSAFSMDTVALWERGAIGAAVAYVLASVCLSIAAVAIGLSLVRS